MALIDDIRSFENLPLARRKWVLSQLFDLRRVIAHDFKDSPDKVTDFEIGIKALDAIHHLSKDGEELIIKSDAPE